MTTVRLWELSEEIKELENAIASIADDDTLNSEDKEVKLQEAFATWLSVGDSFKAKAEQVARYIKHQEVLVQARKAEVKRIKELATIAENHAKRLRKYLSNQMLLTNCDRIDGVTVKIGLRRKQPRVLLKVTPEELPSEYTRKNLEADLVKIRAALKEDPQKLINWAEFSENHEHSVNIK